MNLSRITVVLCKTESYEDCKEWETKPEQLSNFSFFISLSKKDLPWISAICSDLSIMLHVIISLLWLIILMSLCIIGEAKLSIRSYGNHSHGVNEPEGPDCRGTTSVLPNRTTSERTGVGWKALKHFSLLEQTLRREFLFTGNFSTVLKLRKRFFYNLEILLFALL